MAISIDDIDLDGEEYGFGEETTTQDIDNQLVPEDSNNSDNDSYLNPLENHTEEDLTSDELDDKGVIAEFLKSKGLTDLSRITYETDDEQEELYDWDNLSSAEKLAILNQLTQHEEELDDSEVQLINAIRSSKMSPQEYLNYITQRGINEYLQNTQEPQQIYEIDLYSREDLYIADLIARVGRDNITDDEAREALLQAKVNEELFNKHTDAIRNEYKKMEDENRNYQLYVEQQAKQEQFNQFANSVRDQIIDFNDFQGYDLNMDDEDKEELYDFITGFDEAGNSILGKAMNDPAILVRMAWFALHGEQMMDDVSEYIKSTVTQVRRESYNKGVEDARAGKVKDSSKKPTLAFRPKTNTKSDRLSIDDLY